MEVLRTPEERFENLPGYPFAPRYVEVEGLRMHYVEDGPTDADPVLLLHGEPSWSYLYRKMIPPLADAGHRVVAPDLVGFGRSDKPARREDYTYARHLDWTMGFIEKLGLCRITLVCQDWGGLIGLRLAAEHPELFDRIVAANTFLPDGRDPGPLFKLWRTLSGAAPIFPAGLILQLGCVTRLPREVRAAYDAPFPGERHKAGARQFPRLVPTSPDDPEAENNRRAWQVLERWDKPFLTAFSDSDPITRGADRIFRERIPGAGDQPHTTIPAAGHFLQEDQGPTLASAAAEFIARTK